MDFSIIKTVYLSKKQQLSNEINRFVEKANNYNKYYIDFDELEWNDAIDRWSFEILQNTMLMYDLIITELDVAMCVGDDKKEKHRFNKDIETLITSIRRTRNESKEIIEREQAVIDETEAALALLDAIRNN